MSETPHWPAYQIGPRDSIFAIGVVSVNYAQLEFAVNAMFAAILEIGLEASSRLTAKIGPEMKDKLMREMLPSRTWTADVAELALYFIEAHKICYENRNQLIHSRLSVGSTKATLLYKHARSGKTILANPLLSELRQVADDMHALTWFGIHLSNMINVNLRKIDPQEGDFAFPTWPEKLPLPIPLGYTSDLRPVRREP